MPQDRLWGAFLLSASGVHANWIDWNRVRKPLGYIPAAAVVGFQNELRGSGWSLSASRSSLARWVGVIARHPYGIAALLSAYGVLELMKSALHLHERGLVAISAADALGVSFLALLDYGPVAPREDVAALTTAPYTNV